MSKLKNSTQHTFLVRILDTWLALGSLVQAASRWSGDQSSITSSGCSATSSSPAVISATATTPTPLPGTARSTIFSDIMSAARTYSALLLVSQLGLIVKCLNFVTYSAV